MTLDERMAAFLETMGKVRRWIKAHIPSYLTVKISYGDKDYASECGMSKS